MNRQANRDKGTPREGEREPRARGRGKEKSRRTRGVGREGHVPPSRQAGRDASTGGLGEGSRKSGKLEPPSACVQDAAEEERRHLAPGRGRREGRGRLYQGCEGNVMRGNG